MTAHFDLLMVIKIVLAAHQAKLLSIARRKPS
jgi:hypothetical protein